MAQQGVQTSQKRSVRQVFRKAAGVLFQLDFRVGVLPSEVVESVFQSMPCSREIIAMNRQLLNSTPEQRICSPGDSQDQLTHDSTTALLESAVNRSDIAKVSAAAGEFEPESCSDSALTPSLKVRPIETLSSDPSVKVFVREYPW